MEIVSTWHSLFVVAHELDEIVEQIVRIVRPRRCFRVILDAENRLAAMAESFECLVIQIDVSDIDVIRFE
jgi:hypothetical protein